MWLLLCVSCCGTAAGGDGEPVVRGGGVVAVVGAVAGRLRGTLNTATHSTLTRSALNTLNKHTLNTHDSGALKTLKHS